MKRLCNLRLYQVAINIKKYPFLNYSVKEALFLSEKEEVIINGIIIIREPLSLIFHLIQWNVSNNKWNIPTNFNPDISSMTYEKE